MTSLVWAWPGTGSQQSPGFCLHYQRWLWQSAGSSEEKLRKPEGGGGRGEEEEDFLTNFQVWFFFLTLNLFCPEFKKTFLKRTCGGAAAAVLDRMDRQTCDRVPVQIIGGSEGQTKDSWSNNTDVKTGALYLERQLGPRNAPCPLTQVLQIHVITGWTYWARRFTGRFLWSGNKTCPVVLHNAALTFWTVFFTILNKKDKVFKVKVLHLLKSYI